MGAKYDWLEVSSEVLPKYLKNEEQGWQAKGLKEGLCFFKIDRHHQLWERTESGNWNPCQMDYPNVTFYKITGHIERWTEYKAKFKNGRLIELLQTDGKLADFHILKNLKKA